MQIKATMRYFTMTKLAKKSTPKSCERILSRVWIGTPTLENNLSLCSENEVLYVLWPGNSTFIYIYWGKTVAQLHQERCTRMLIAVLFIITKHGGGAWGAQSVGRPTSARSRSRSPWVRAPRQALGWWLRAWSLFPILCLPLSLPLHRSHSLSLSK